MGSLDEFIENGRTYGARGRERPDEQDQKEAKGGGAHGWRRTAGDGKTDPQREQQREGIKGGVLPSWP